MIRRTFGALTLAAAIGGSVLVPTPASAESSVVIRFYDRDHHDYHRWNREEDRSCREQHKSTSPTDAEKCQYVLHL